MKPLLPTFKEALEIVSTIEQVKHESDEKKAEKYVDRYIKDIVKKIHKGYSYIEYRERKHVKQIALRKVAEKLLEKKYVVTLFYYIEYDIYELTIYL